MSIGKWVPLKIEHEGWYQRYFTYDSYRRGVNGNAEYTAWIFLCDGQYWVVSKAQDDETRTRYLHPDAIGPFPDLDSAKLAYHVIYGA